MSGPHDTVNRGRGNTPGVVIMVTLTLRIH